MCHVRCSLSEDVVRCSRAAVTTHTRARAQQIDGHTRGHTAGRSDDVDLGR